MRITNKNLMYPALLLCMSLWLSLSAQAETSSNPILVSGTVIYLQRMALPPNAIVNISVEDISRADAASVTISQMQIHSPSNPPIAFSLPVESQKIEASHRYSVRANITADDKLLFTSDTIYPVLNEGSTNKVEILLRMINANMPPKSTPKKVALVVHPLENTNWTLQKLEGINALPLKEGNPNFKLNAKDKRVSGFGGCNRLMSGYQINANQLFFSQAATTMMACATGMDVEMAFHNMLPKVSYWKIKADTLFLLDDKQQVLAQFKSEKNK